MTQYTDFTTKTHFITPHIEFHINSLEVLHNFSWDNCNELIAKHFGIKKNEFELFHNKSSAIFSLLKYLSLKKCYLYSPTDKEYQRATNIFEYTITSINRFDTIEEKVEEDSLVIFTNPSYPDGLYYDLTILFQQWMKANATIIIDESFLDFTNEKSSIAYLKCYPKLFILKSFAHFYGIAHLQTVALISHKIAIAQLKQKEPKDKISPLDGYYICESLKDKSFNKIAKALSSKSNIFLEKILQKSNLFDKVYPSSTNIILAKLSKLKSIELQQTLLKDKILIEDCSNLDFLDEYHVSLSVQNTKDLELLEKRFEEINKNSL